MEPTIHYLASTTYKPSRVGLSEPKELAELCESVAYQVLAQVVAIHFFNQNNPTKQLLGRQLNVSLPLFLTVTMVLRVLWEAPKIKKIANHYLGALETNSSLNQTIQDCAFWMLRKIFNTSYAIEQEMGKKKLLYKTSCYATKAINWTFPALMMAGSVSLLAQGKYTQGGFAVGALVAHRLFLKYYHPASAERLLCGSALKFTSHAMYLFSGGYLVKAMAAVLLLLRDLPNLNEDLSWYLETT